MKSGIELIADERQRQIDEEGRTSEYDDKHTDGSLIGAALSYAGHALARIAIDGGIEPHQAALADNLYRIVPASVAGWPDTWLKGWWKPTTPIRDLTKAGALIAAEIDRRQRMKHKELTSLGGE